jgi:hypothetical protein
MKDNRLGGVALIAGAIAGMITMSLHPSGHHVIMSPREMEMLALLTRAVHGLGIVALPLSFLGCMVITRRLASPNRLSVAALVVYGFAAIAIMMAASMSGFVAPGVMSKLVAGDPPFVSRLHFPIESSIRGGVCRRFLCGDPPLVGRNPEDSTAGGWPRDLWNGAGARYRSSAL